MALNFSRHFAVALTVVAVAGTTTHASAGWKTEDATCSPSRQPASTSIAPATSEAIRASDWVEAWAAWWSRCTTTADSPLPPLLCADGSRQRVTDSDGGCLTFTCQGGTYDIRPCADTARTGPMPRLAGVRLFSGGYAALVEHKGGSKEDVVAAGDVPLVYTLRALIANSKLPDKDLMRVPQTFWRRQRPITQVDLRHSVSAAPPISRRSSGSASTRASLPAW